MKDKIIQKHTELFGQPALVIRSPGRANIIGEHTDYNDGFVLPFAIDKCIYLAASQSTTGSSSIYATDTDCFEKDIQNRTDGFLQYFQSVRNYFKTIGFDIGHFNITFGGDLPIGAGVSSSSAISCGFVRICQAFAQTTMSKTDIVQAAHAAERGAGVEGGMMDQFAIVHGEKDKVICLDCRDRSWFDLDINTGSYEFILINTHVEHQLAETAYNTRVAECKEGLSIIQQRDSLVMGFRDIRHHHLSYIQTPNQDRLQHVIEENERLRLAVDAIRNQNMIKLGKLLNASHASLRDLYKVSCDELDFVAARMDAHEHVSGARMMGGGFGGCVIALVKKNKVEEIVTTWQEEYSKRFGRSVSWFAVQPSAGLEVV